MSREKMLLVDDDSDIRTIAKMTLEMIGGWEVHCVASGSEALQHLQPLQSDPPPSAAGPAVVPDLIVLDVMMPGMDGPDTARALRQLPALAQVPIVFMTAKAQRREVERLMGLGATAVITKPFDPMTLSQVIREAVQRSRSA